MAEYSCPIICSVNYHVRRDVQIHIIGVCFVGFLGGFGIEHIRVCIDECSPCGTVAYIAVGKCDHVNISGRPRSIFLYIFNETTCHPLNALSDAEIAHSLPIIQQSLNDA